MNPKFDDEVSDMLFDIIAKKLLAKTRECESLYDYIKELEKFREDALAKKEKVAYYARVPECELTLTSKWDCWMPVDCVAPAHGKRVLVKLQNSRVAIATYFANTADDKKWLADTGVFLPKTVVSWKELDE